MGDLSPENLKKEVSQFLRVQPAGSEVLGLTLSLGGLGCCRVPSVLGWENPWLHIRASSHLDSWHCPVLLSFLT